jgi:hypothetical protein
MQIINGTPEEIAAYELALKDGKKNDFSILINPIDTSKFVKYLKIAADKESRRICEPPVDTMKSAYHSAFQKANHDTD